MSFRESFSRFRKRVKDELSKIGDGSERRRADFGGEGFHRSALSSQSEPGVVGHDQGGDDKASGGETGQSHLHPHPCIQVESGSGQKRSDANGKQANPAYPSLQSDVGSMIAPGPSISRGGESSEST